jgi:hypothetical protein
MAYGGRLGTLIPAGCPPTLGYVQLPMANGNPSDTNNFDAVNTLIEEAQELGVDEASEETEEEGGDVTMGDEWVKASFAKDKNALQELLKGSTLEKSLATVHQLMRTDHLKMRTDQPEMIKVSAEECQVATRANLKQVPLIFEISQTFDKLSSLTDDVATEVI